MITPLEVFYSYAHEDEALRDELDKHLKLLERQDIISGWHDREITAGSAWRNQIDGHLETAGIILLLVSADFLASDYCYDVELKRALEREAAQEARVIPVILRAVDWQEAPFGHLQALPKDARPVTSWHNRDEAFRDIAQGLRNAIGERSIRTPQAGKSPERSVSPQVLTSPPATSKLRGLWDALNESTIAKLGVLGSFITALTGAAWMVYTHFIFTIESDRLVEAGNGFLNVGRYPEAKQAFEDALKADPRNEDALWGARVAKTWESSAFEQEVKNLADIRPNDSYVQLMQGQLFAAEHDNPKARKAFEEAVQLNPKLAEAYFGLGVVYDQSGYPELAESAFQQAAERSRTTPKYWNNLAYWHYKHGKYPQALREYGRTSTFPLAALESAKIYWRQGNLGSALEKQELALGWLDDQALMTKPEQRDPWYFELGREGVEVNSTIEKRAYAALSLAITQYLAGQVPAADERAKTAFQSAQPSRSIMDVLRYELSELASEKPEYADKLQVFEKQYLVKEGAR